MLAREQLILVLFLCTYKLRLSRNYPVVLILTAFWLEPWQLPMSAGAPTAVFSISDCTSWLSSQLAGAVSGQSSYPVQLTGVAGAVTLQTLLAWCHRCPPSASCNGHDLCTCMDGIGASVSLICKGGSNPSYCCSSASHIVWESQASTEPTFSSCSQCPGLLELGGHSF
jgi:hypothetical protein